MKKRPGMAHFLKKRILTTIFLFVRRLLLLLGVVLLPLAQKLQRDKVFEEMATSFCTGWDQCS